MQSQLLSDIKLKGNILIRQLCSKEMNKQTNKKKKTEDMNKRKRERKDTERNKPKGRNEIQKQKT